MPRRSEKLQSLQSLQSFLRPSWKFRYDIYGYILYVYIIYIYIYILAWTCAYPCTECRGIDEETILKSRSLFRWLVKCISHCILRSTFKDYGFWGRVGWSWLLWHVWDPLPRPSASPPLCILTSCEQARVAGRVWGEYTHVGGPGIQVRGPGGRLAGPAAGWQGHVADW